MDSSNQWNKTTQMPSLDNAIEEIGTRQEWTDEKVASEKWYSDEGLEIDDVDDQLWEDVGDARELMNGIEILSQEKRTPRLRPRPKTRSGERHYHCL